MRFGEANDAVAGAAQRRVNAENDLVQARGRAQGRFQNGRGHARRAAETRFDLLELLRRDAH